jgi:Fe-S oxidoreductase
MAATMLPSSVVRPAVAEIDVAALERALPDTFTDDLHPAVAKAAVEVLEDAGYRVVFPDGAVRCGLTWISTGQLDVAKHVLRRTAGILAPCRSSASSRAASPSSARTAWSCCRRTRTSVC